MENHTDNSIALLTAYIDAFHDLNESQIRNFAIKKAHSLRVAERAEFISLKLKLNEDDASIAKLAALFHDIGRFWQLYKYNTFDDSKSGDHAKFSVEIIKREGFLKTLGCPSEDVVLSAIIAHNKFEIPESLTERELLHAKILRDADKLDILEVLARYYSQSDTKPNHSLSWKLPEGYEVSDNVARNVLAGKVVNKQDVRSETDVRVMQLSWIYDLNFECSIEYAQNFFETIYNSLPKTDTVIAIYRNIKEFGENRITA